MLLTFEKLREIHLNEKSESLQKLPENFFNDARAYLVEKDGSVEGKTASRLLSALQERRMKKIVNMALLYFSTERVPENLEVDEMELYGSVVGLLRKHVKSIGGFSRDSDVKNNLVEGTSVDLKGNGGLESSPIGLCEPTSSREQNVNLEGPSVLGEEKGSCGGEDTSENETQKPPATVEFMIDTPELMIPGIGAKTFSAGERLELDEKIANFLVEKKFCKWVIGE